MKINKYNKEEVKNLVEIANEGFENGEFNISINNGVVKFFGEKWELVQGVWEGKIDWTLFGLGEFKGIMSDVVLDNDNNIIKSILPTWIVE